ncbi:unnamed protein product, partial [Effrenium voratum]
EMGEQFRWSPNEEEMGQMLLQAVFMEDQVTLEHLIKQKANLESKDETGATPLHIAVTRNMPQTVSWLLRHRANCAAKDGDGYHALTWACIKGHLQVVKILLEANASIEEAASSNGKTPLSLAAERGHMEVVELLLAKQARVDQTNADGSTPLHAAAHQCEVEIVAFLLARKSMVNAADGEGWTPLMYATNSPAAVSDGPRPELGERKVQVDGVIGRKSTLELLLLHKADVNAQSIDGLSPLIIVSAHDRPHAAKQLLEAKAQVNMTGAKGQTAMLMAASNDFPTVAKTLVLGNADVSGKATDFFQDYRPLADILVFLRHLAAAHPRFARLTEIGRSWQGRPLHALEITDYSDGTDPADKPCIFLEGGIHAREWIATSSVLYIGNSLLQDAADSASEVQRLLRHFLFTLVVPVNPDGYVYTWEVNRMWRKSRSNRTDHLCNGKVAGVDLNRNWGVTFGQSADYYYKRQLQDPCSEVYIGPGPFSEPETEAVSSYMERRQQRSVRLKTAAGPGPGYVAAFIDYHSYAEAMLPPWAYTAETPVGPDGVYQTQMTSFLNEAFFNVSGRRFRAGADVFPPDPGTGPDWAYGRLGTRATMTIELEGHSFCLPRTQIEGVGREQYAGAKALARFILQHGGEPATTLGLFSEEPMLGMPPEPTSQVGWWLLGAILLVASASMSVGCLFAARKRRGYDAALEMA